MAYKTFDESSINSPQAPQNEQISLKIDGPQVSVPDASFIKDSAITRDGADLVLTNDDSSVIIEGYYNTETPPTLTAPDGASLSPALVNSFTTSTPRFANADSGISDVSPVGAVNEISGNATVTHLDGTTETVTQGTPIYQGDIVETDASGAVNIIFQDDTKFAISEEARLAIDEFVYDPSTEAGTTNFSVLKGVFVFTSGLIGREDPDDVHIETPVGSIGIRGTIIAGDVNSGEITVVEGAIVLNDFNGNEITLANQFETAKFGGDNGGIQHMGELAANDVAGRFSGVSGVAPDLFSSINDAAQENAADDGTGEDAQDGETATEQQAEDQDAAAEDAQDTTEGQAEGEQAAPQEEAAADAEVESTEAEAANEAEAAAEETKAEANDTQNAENAEAEAKAEAKADQDPANNAESGQEGRGQDAKTQDAAAQESPTDAKPANQQAQQQQQTPNQPQQNAGNENQAFGENAGQALGTEALNFSLGTNEGVAGRPAGQGQGQGQGQGNTTANQPNPNTPPQQFNPEFGANGTAGNNNNNNNTNSTGTGTNAGDDPAVTVGPDPFYITTVATPIVENTMGGILGTITGTNGIITAITFTDPITHNFVDIIQNGNNWDFVLKSGETFDFEDTDINNTYLDFTATISAADGTTSYTDSLYVIVDDIDEAIDHHLSEPLNAHVTHEGAVRTFQFGKDFFDPENNITFDIGTITARVDANHDGYFNGTSITESLAGVDLDADDVLTGLAVNETNAITDLSQLTNYLDFGHGSGIDGGSSNVGWDFDSITGELTLYFDNPNFAHNLEIDIEILATDGIAGNANSAIYTIQADYLDANHSGEASGINTSITGNDFSKILTTYDDDFTISASSGGNSIFTIEGEDEVTIYGGAGIAGGSFVDTGNDNDTITLSGSNAAYNTVKGGSGDDTFTVNTNAGGSGGNNLMGGEGFDTFYIGQSSNNHFDGGADNDAFVFDVGNVPNALIDIRTSGAQQTFHGGSGFDEIRVNGTPASTNQGTLDFTNIDANTFRDIETINLTDGADYTVLLTAEDIFQMTNNENTLQIDGDSGDSVDLTADGGKAFFLEDFDATHNTYSNGDVTLIIDADVNVGGLLTGL